MANKNYRMIKTIENDAPYGNINYYSISFLTPEKYDKTKWMTLLGFKIHTAIQI